MSSWRAAVTCRPRDVAAVECAEAFPDLKSRVINVRNLMKLSAERASPWVERQEFDVLFTTTSHYLCHHGTVALHRLPIAVRTSHLHWRHNKEEGTTTTPSTWLSSTTLTGFTSSPTSSPRAHAWSRAAYALQAIREKLIEHKRSSPHTAWTCRRSATGDGV